MKRWITAVCLAMSALTLLAAKAAAAEVAAESAVVYEPRTGTVLFEKNADERKLVASTTKIMTALVALEHCDLGETVTATAAQAATEGSSMYLQPGEDYTVEELLYGLLLVSGNDAAAALAEHCAGSMEAFAALMNEKCAALGLENTHFVNSHGLDDDDHYSSARDLALITAAAMENADFCRIFATRSYTCREQTYVNHNKLLSSCDGCIGGKTGYTSAAGRILVSCAERNGLRLICVTVSDPDDWADHSALYDEYFGAYRYVPLPGSGWERLNIVSGTKSHVRLRCDVPGLLVPAEAELQLTVRLPRFAFAPTIYGAAIGSVEVSLNGGEAHSIPISVAEGVQLDPAVPLTAWEKFKRAWFTANRYSGLYYMAY